MLMRSLPGVCRPAARRLTACNAAAMLVPARSVSSNGTGTYQKTQFREADPTKPKLVLAYSGGLDTSCQLRYLSKEMGFEVVAYIADLGQDDVLDKEAIDTICQKAELSGAYAFYCEDLKGEFVKDYVFECIRANALYEGRYLLGTAMARPCIAKRQVEIAHLENATYVSHGSTGKGNDQVRFEVCYLGMDPALQCVTLWRQREYLEKFEGRQDLIDYASAHGIPVAQTKEADGGASFSTDENIMHISYESGVLEDPALPGWTTEYPAEMWVKTAAIPDTPDTPTNLTIEFEKGYPIKVTDHTNGVTVTDALELFIYLNKVGGENGVGRLDIVENRFIGMKSRGCYETPGGHILFQSHLDLETLTIDREVMRIRDTLSIKYAELVYNGYWFAPEMQFLKVAMEHAQEVVTGKVDVQLLKGNTIMRGRSSPVSLYNKELVSMDVEGGFNPEISTGFIQTLSTRIKASAARGKMM